MTASVRLVAGEIREGSARLLRVPRWVRPDDAEHYWHVPRSAEIPDAELQRRYRRDIKPVVLVHFWCGGYRWTARENLTSKPFEGALLCATCDGRAKGFERENGLIFSPRSPFDTPKLCPALLANDERLCPFCGGKERFRRSYCHYDQVQHAPGPDFARFVQPCPRHGWKKASRRGRQIVCVTDWPRRPEFDCGFVLGDAGTQLSEQGRKDD
jgi:hypothetical protein